MSRKARHTWASLAAEIGIDISELRRMCRRNGIESPNADRKLVNQALMTSKKTGDGEIDPETGLVLDAALVKEKLKTQRLENDARERELDDEWVKRSWHYDMLAGLCSRLEAAPYKCKSLLGLTEDQRAGMQKVLDDIRREFADNAPEPA